MGEYLVPPGYVYPNTTQFVPLRGKSLYLKTYDLYIATPLAPRRVYPWLYHLQRRKKDLVMQLLRHKQMTRVCQQLHRGKSKDWRSAMVRVVNEETSGKLEADVVEKWCVERAREMNGDYVPYPASMLLTHTHTHTHLPVIRTAGWMNSSHHRGLRGSRILAERIATVTWRPTTRGAPS